MIARRLDPSQRPPVRLPAGAGLPPAKKARLALEILVAYRFARRELRASPIAEAVARLRSGSLVEAGSPASLREARRLAAVVRRTLAPLPGDTRCLTQSLVLSRLLARRGIASTLVIGASGVPEFGAHAWVEHDGEPLGVSDEWRYPRLVEL